MNEILNFGAANFITVCERIYWIFITDCLPVANFFHRRNSLYFFFFQLVKLILYEGRENCFVG